MSNMPVPTESTVSQSGALGQLQHFLRWWKSSLLSTLPGWLRGLGSDIVVYYRLRLEEDGLRVHGGGRHGLSFESATPATLGDLTNPGAHITLEVPDSMALTKRVNLPSVNISLLDEFARHLLPRHTPFDAGSCYFGYRLTSATGVGASPTGRAIELIVVPRRALAETAAQLAGHGIRLDALRVRGEDRLLGQVDLLAGDDPLRRPRRSSPLRRLLVASLFLLLALNLALPFYRQTEYSAALEKQIAGLRSDAEAARALPGKIDAILQRADYMQSRRHQAIDALGALESLSRSLPDDSWLQRLQMARGKVEIIGESDNASALIELLQASDAFEQPQFTRALVRSPRSGKERFTLRAELRPNGERR